MYSKAPTYARQFCGNYKCLSKIYTERNSLLKFEEICAVFCVHCFT